MGSLRAERRHAWEEHLSEEREEALLKQIESFRDGGHDLLLHHEGGKLDVLEPPMVVSLHALSEAARTRDAKAVLEEWSQGSVDGKALRLTPDWYAKPVSGDAATFTALAYDLLQNARTEVHEIDGAASDENRGTIELTVRGDAGSNTVVIDLARVVAEIHRRRAEDDKTPLSDMVRELLKAAVGRDADGVLWVRKPSAADRSIARRAIESAQTR